MKIFVIGHEDAVLGFGLVGVKGLVTSDRQTTLTALESAARNPEWGIVLVTSDVAGLIRSELAALEKSADRPLVLEIPAPNDTAQKVSMRQLVRQAVGASV